MSCGGRTRTARDSTIPIIPNTSGRTERRRRTLRLRPLLKILDYAESRKIDVMLGEWQWPVDLGPGRPIGGPEDPRWARMIADFVHYLTRVREVHR